MNLCDFMEKKKRIFIIFTMMFAIGALLGFGIEYVWYFVKHGTVLSKPGLLYGPFKPIYGLGCLLMVALYYLFKKEKVIIVYIVGTVLGGAFEYLMAVIPETLFKVTYWRYDSFNLNIDGKVYIPYCFVWGLLFVIFIKYIYPKLEEKVIKTPFVVVLILNIFLVLDAALTSIAVYQYSNRVHNIPTTNSVLKLIDKKYDNDYMKKRFPNMRIKKEVKKNG